MLSPTKSRICLSPNASSAGIKQCWESNNLLLQGGNSPGEEEPCGKLGPQGRARVKT